MALDSAIMADAATREEEPLEGNYFVAAYPPFSCWTEAENGSVQRALDAEPPPPSIRPQPAPVPLGLYVHIPFCVHRCQYCYYLCYADQADQVQRYLDALNQELTRLSVARQFSGRQLDFVYFGGGTPSLLTSDQIRELLANAQRLFPWSALREATFECAPRTVTSAKVDVLWAMGVTRVSLGVQQMDDQVLAANGRVHLVQDVERAYSRIRQREFPIVNIDLIVGLVDETEETFFRSLEQVIGMEPESITIYQLEIPRNTPLFQNLKDPAFATRVPGWETKRRRLGEAFSRLEAKGYAMQSAYTAVRNPRHDRFLYMSEQYRGADLIGAGVAAFSYVNGLHYQNIATLPDYTAAVEAGRGGTGAGALPIGRTYALSEEEQWVREFVLQLKLGQVDSSSLRAKFGVDVMRNFAEPLARLRAAGWLKIDEGRVILTRAGLLRVDRMLPEFYLPKHKDVRYS